MGALSCLSNPWTGDDFTPCFREIVINEVIPILTLIASAILIIKAIVEQTRSSSPQRAPLLASHTNGATQYGTVDTNDDIAETLEEEEEGPLPRWSLYNIARLLASVLQCALVSCAIVWIVNGSYNLDPTVETNGSTILTVYSIQTVYWVYALILSGTIALSRNKSVADTMWVHVNLVYACAFLIDIVNLRSFYITHGHDITSTGYKIALGSSSVAFLLLTMVLNEERYNQLYVKSSSGRVKSAEFRASLISRFMFSYATPMLKKGYRETLNDEDLHELPTDRQTKHTLTEYEKHKSTNLLWSFAWTFRRPLLQEQLYSLAWCLFMFCSPFALNKIISFIEHPDGASGLTPYLYVIGMFIASTLQSLSHQQDLYIGRATSIGLQSVIIGEVYSKSLRRRQHGKSSSDENQDDKPEGNINNLMSVDANKVGDIPVYLPFILSFTIQVAVCGYALYQLLGIAALYGIGLLVISQPLFYQLSNKVHTFQNILMGFTDKRIKQMNELLNAIRIIKFFAWESEFRKRIRTARDLELKAARSRLVMFGILDTGWFLLTVTIMVLVFYVYTYSYPLTASTAFTALSLFNILKMALEELPYVVTFVIQGYVSLKRVEKFLEEDEIQPLQSTVSWDNRSTIGFINNASFSWDSKSTKPILRNLNLTFPSQKLSIVCGPTGSGKSTLLSSLLGETYCHSGSAVLPKKHQSLSPSMGGAVSGVAYVAQTAWLQNCSIRDNILFGLPYNQERYEKVIFMTALSPDLKIFEHGDRTEVGEKGITLSGGQKQRVAIARAVYSQADTIIFDDCLSAVDAHTAKHLYEHCLTGEFLRDRTVILVTHHVSLCIKGADYVVALKDGEVVAAGNPQDVKATGLLGKEAPHSDEDETSATTSATDKEPILEETKTLKPDVDDSKKLTKEEKRAEGATTWKVYAHYFYASGGFMFWSAVILFFGLSQAATIGQDVWIKVWSSATSETNNGSYPEEAPAATLQQTGHIFTNMVLIPLNQWSSHLSSYTNESISYYIGIYTLLGIIAVSTFGLRLIILFAASIRASRHIHTELLDKILSAKVRFFDTTPIGQIINRFSSDIETIDQEIAPVLAGLLHTLVAAPFVIMLIAYIVPLFLIPGAFIGILFWIISVYYLNTSRDMKRLNSVSRSPIYVHFHETVGGVATIRAFGCQSRFIAENHKKVDDNIRPNIWMWNVNRWLHCRIDLLGSLVGLVTGIGLLITRSSIDAGLAGLALSNSLLFTRIIILLVRLYAMHELNCNSIERVQEYLEIEEEPAHIESTCPRSSWPETGSVKVDQLVMKYSPESPPVLHGISFETRPREKVGIVGRTGSGKSTLALSLFRFMEATSGSIKIDGVDISQLGLHDLRSRLTIIPQDPVLFSGTLRSNLDPFAEFTDAELYVALKRSHLTRDGEDITLDSHVAENGSNWSQGQRQLIALARALVKRSSLIVLDEATSSVDFDTDQRIQDTIRSELFADSALLCIAHRLRTVADYDRILVLDQGKVVEFDTPYALMTRENSLFYQMCERSGEFQELLTIVQQKGSSFNA